MADSTYISSPEVTVPKPTASFNWLYGVLAIVALSLFGVGIYLAIARPPEWTMLAAGCLSLIGVGMTWPIAHSLAAAHSAHADARELGRRVDERLEKIAQVMARVSDQQLLSDRAKAVAFRDKDREAIRRAIQEDIERQEWDQAYALANQFEKAFGSHHEAERLREEINGRKAEGVRQQIAEVVAVIDRHTRAEQWNQALREAERVMKRYPNDEQVKNLPYEIESRRQTHKKQLLSSWHEAVARHDVDGSIEVLKQLDTYLTPAEAESMQETARNIYREKLHNLGAEFASAVRENRVQDAVRIGEQIQADFPNSRIAQEVRETIPALRQRAAEPAATPA